MYVSKKLLVGALAIVIIGLLGPTFLGFSAGAVEDQEAITQELQEQIEFLVQRIEGLEEAVSSLEEKIEGAHHRDMLSDYDWDRLRFFITKYFKLSGFGTDFPIEAEQLHCYLTNQFYVYLDDEAREERDYRVFVNGHDWIFEDWKGEPFYMRGRAFEVKQELVIELRDNVSCEVALSLSLGGLSDIYEGVYPGAYVAIYRNPKGLPRESGVGFYRNDALQLYIRFEGNFQNEWWDYDLSKLEGAE